MRRSVEAMAVRGSTDSERNPRFRQLATLAAMCVLLVVIGAASAFAEESNPQVPQANSAGTGPGAAEVAEGIAEAEEQEAQREEELETPAFLRQREQSRTAYTDASPAEAKDLLLSSFPGELAAQKPTPPAPSATSRSKRSSTNRSPR